MIVEAAPDTLLQGGFANPGERLGKLVIFRLGQGIIGFDMSGAF